MERDFLSLNWKEKSTVICKNSVGQLVSSSTSSPAAAIFPFTKIGNKQNSSSTVKQLPPIRRINNVGNLSGAGAGAGTTTTTPLTIFYSGCVHVYNYISPQKAEAIIRMAGNSSSETEQIPKPSGLVVSTNQTRPYPTQNSSGTFKTGVISMARKATLVRFLEKRKARLIDGMPYNVSGKFMGIHKSSPTQI